MTTDPDIAALAEERPFVARIARGLVASSADADDIAQDTYLAALKHPPKHDNHRSWLSRVARNAARMNHRSQRRRQAREDSAWEPEPASDGFAETQRAQARALVSRAVNELAEPYRSAVVLRFGRELSVAKVAEELDVPVGTAGWRINEGLKRLRRDLDRQAGGDARPYLLALCPPVGVSELTTAATTANSNGVPVMLKKVLLTLCLAVVVTAAAVARSKTSLPAVHDIEAAVLSSASVGAQDTAGFSPTGTLATDNAAAAGLRPPIAEVSDHWNLNRVTPENFLFAYHSSPDIDDRPNARSDSGGSSRLLAGCIDALIEKDPDVGARRQRVSLELHLVDEDGQVTVASSSVREDLTTISDRTALECIAESGFAAQFDGATDSVEELDLRIDVEYVPSSEATFVASLAMKACVAELEKRRPGLFAAGNIDDPEFDRCMMEANPAFGDAVTNPEENESIFKCIDEVKRLHPTVTAAELPTHADFKSCMTRSGLAGVTIDEITFEP